MQSSLDSAALAAVIPGNMTVSERERFAEKIFSENFEGKSTVENMKVEATASNARVDITAQAAQKNLSDGTIRL